MSKRRVFQSLAVVLMLASTVVSCDLAKSASSRPTVPVGTNEGEMKEKITEVLKGADTTPDQVEIAEISSSSNYNNKATGDTYSLSLDIVSPKDKNKIARTDWYSSEQSPSRQTTENLILSDADNNVIKEYDKFKDMLFSYGDVEMYINNTPTLFKEALEAAGYDKEGYVKYFTIRRDPSKGNEIIASIRVQHKSTSSLSKYFRIAKDGTHIIKN